MSSPHPARLERLVDSLPLAYPGPGGAVAVLREGEVLVRHAWGYANAERRIAFTPQSLFRMCSITKQFTCSAMLAAFPDPSRLDEAVRAQLPLLEGEIPSALHLAHNQSGLRDYWAVAMLHGAPAESGFGPAEARQVIGGTRSLHFDPGTRYTYANNNFRILSEALEAQTGRSFGELLRQYVFEPAGMHSAFLAADTRAMPDGTQGYEGTQTTGFRAAENNIIWTGDAGLGASLDDMIAWERYIDATRDNASLLYRRLSAPVSFADGNTAHYGFGLARGTTHGRELTSHSGALRGWRSHRLYVPQDRISVVVMFNHLSNAHLAASELLSAVLDVPPTVVPKAVVEPADWFGSYLEPQTGLSVSVQAAGKAEVSLRFGHPPEILAMQADSTAGSDGTRLRWGDDGLWMERPSENFRTRLVPLAGAVSREIAGRYRCAELEAELTIADTGGAHYGGFSGCLGQGRMELLHCVGDDVWTLPCPRALDHTPPGDWTLAFRRQDGRVSGVKVGCWLARNLIYERMA